MGSGPTSRPNHPHCRMAAGRSGPDNAKLDRIVAEANQGGDMVRTVLRTVDPSVPVKLVHATRGKRVRAEPVAALYEQGRVRLAGVQEPIVSLVKLDIVAGELVLV